MNKTRTFKLLHTRPFWAWVAPFISAAVLYSLFVCCICGPFCADAAPAKQSILPVPAESGCCPSEAPVEVPAADPCCPDEPGEHCCDHDVSENALQESVSTDPVFRPAAKLVTGSFTALPKVQALRNLFRPDHVSHGPPSYIRFQILLI